MTISRVTPELMLVEGGYKCDHIEVTPGLMLVEGGYKSDHIAGYSRINACRRGL